MAERSMTLRLDEATHERLRREAFEQRVSINALVREAIRARIAGWDLDDSSPWPVSRASARLTEETNR